LATLPPEDFEHIDVSEEIHVENAAFKEVLVHIDLKGAPPKFEFLLEFINYLLTKPTGRHVITGFLFEFEDMFPYRDNLHALRSDTVPAYSVEQVKHLVNLVTQTHRLKFVPLCQTFGHLEIALKRPQFSHLREQPNQPSALCPLNPQSLGLVFQMVQQIVQTIGKQNIEFFHIGVDEIFHLGSCEKCRIFAQEAGRRVLFARHVRKLLKRLNTEFPTIRFIGWDDMFRGWSTMELDYLKPGANHSLQPCIW
jgi:hexosaminidase